VQEQQIINVKAAAVPTSGVAAAGVSSAPTPLLGEYLTTHGISVLSYAEVIQVAGFLYVVVLLGRMAIPSCKWLIKLVRR